MRSGSVAAALEVEPGAAIASPVADASAAVVAGVLGAGAAEALSTFDGGLGLGADGLAEVAVAQGGGAAGELVHWLVPFWWSPWMIPLGGCGGVRVSASGHLPRTGEDCDVASESALCMYLPPSWCHSMGVARTETHNEGRKYSFLSSVRG